MRPFPGYVVRRGRKCLGVQRAPRKREHGHGLTYPDALRLQIFLPAMNLSAVISFGKNQVCLHPGNATASIDQQFSDAVCAHAAILIQVFTPFMRNGFHAALNGDTVGAAKKVQSFFIPEIDARLKSDFYRTLSDAFEQAINILADAENLVDEINVLDAARNQRIHFLQNGLNAALPEFIAEERLVAEGAGPGTSASKLQFGAKTVVIGEYVMAMPVRFDVVVLEIQGAKRGHIGDS